MPHFSNHMSYSEIADALRDAQLTSKVLSALEHECISKSLQNPLTANLMELYPLPEDLQNIMTTSQSQHTKQQENPSEKEPGSEKLTQEQRVATLQAAQAQSQSTHRAAFYLTVPFLNFTEQGTPENFSDELYQMYCEVAGYQIVESGTHATTSKTLQRPEIEKKEKEIFDEMLKKYPCFLGAAHLKLVLTLHNLNQSFDGKFETHATFDTLKKAAESGIIPNSTGVIKSERIRNAYTQYLSSQKVPFFYDFYPQSEKDIARLTAILNGNLDQWPCCEDVLLQWLKNNRNNVPVSDAQAQKMAGFAVQTGYTHALKILLEEPWHILLNDLSSREGETLLELATASGNLQIVQILIAKGAHIKENHIMLALEKGHIEIANELIKDSKDQFRFDTALMWAARNGDMEIGMALILKGADIEENHIMLAREKGHPNLVYELIKNYKKGFYSNSRILMKAAKSGDTVLVQTLIKFGAEINCSEIQYIGCYPLIYAAQQGHTETVKALIAGGANINSIDADKKCETALIYAAQEGHTETVKALITARANVNLTDNYKRTALMWAANNSHTETVEALIAARACVDCKDYENNKASDLTVRTDIKEILLKAQYDINNTNQFGRTVLIRAITGEINSNSLKKIFDYNKVDDRSKMKALETVKDWWSTAAIVQAIIDAGADVNIADQDGKTALMHAAANDYYTGTVKVLIAAGADLNIADQDGKTALMCAAKRGHTEIVKALIAADADVNLAHNDGQTALMWAAQDGHTEIVKALIAADADVNLTDNYKRTALMWAVRNGSTETIKALIAAGADLKIADQDGKTALMLAQEKSIDIVNALTEPSAVDGFKQTAFHQILEKAHTEGYIPAKGMPQTQGELQQLILDLFGVIWDKNIPQFTSESLANLEIETFKKQMTFLSYSYADEIYNDPQKKENATWYIEQFDEMLRKKFESSFRYQNPQSLHLYSHLRGTWTGLFYTCARWLFNFFRDKKGLDGNDVKKFDQFIAEQLIQTQKDVNANTLSQQEEKESQTQEIREIAMGLDAQQYSTIVWAGCSEDEKKTWDARKEIITQIKVVKGNSQNATEQAPPFKIIGLEAMSAMFKDVTFINTLWSYILLSPKDFRMQLKDSELTHEERAFAIDLYQHLHQQMKAFPQTDPELRKEFQLDDLLVVSKNHESTTYLSRIGSILPRMLNPFGNAASKKKI